MKPEIILKPIIRCSKRLASVSDEVQLSHQQNKCFYCGRKMLRVGNSKHFHDKCTKDHFFPKSHGFDLVGNKVFACGKCNNSKKDNYPTTIDMYNFVVLHRSLLGKKLTKKLIISTHNGKPRFKLKLTEEVIAHYTSEPLIGN